MRVPPVPALLLSPDRRTLGLADYHRFPGIETLAQPRLKLAGLTFDPVTNGPDRLRFAHRLRLRDLTGGNERPVEGLPTDAALSNPRYSADSRWLYATHTTRTGLSLWRIAVETGRAERLTDEVLNGLLNGAPYRLLHGGMHLLYLRVPADRGPAPRPAPVPPGPIVQEGSGGAAPVITFQNLLSDPHGAALFAHYTAAQLVLLDLRDGSHMPFGAAGNINGVSASPDGSYVLVTYLERPYSYRVPYQRFAKRIVLYDRAGTEVREVVRRPVVEQLPKGFGAVPTGPRAFTWRTDAPAELIYAEAQDGGDPRAEAAVRDRLYRLTAPFGGPAEPLLDLPLRYAETYWLDDERAVSVSYRWADRRIVQLSWSPGQTGRAAEELFSYSWEDRYAHPGTLLTTRNAYDRPVLQHDAAGRLFLQGAGGSPAGDRPFLDRLDPATHTTERLWQSTPPHHEVPQVLLDADAGTLLLRREQRDEPPNYWLYTLPTGTLEQLTHFPHPYPRLREVHRELARYPRADGLELTGKLYLPPGYDPGRDGPLPTLLWAYPKEFKTAAAAAQVRHSPYAFTTLSWSSPVFWVLRGYAVLDDFSVPIVGEGTAEPNDTFVAQLRANADAVVAYLEARGIARSGHLAVGGHSYGAFMTANLLAHTEHFAAGIARSGAYNRTLTPFGFQSEERHFWETPEVYLALSPFVHADRIDAPLLLIHGQDDPNSGTYPMQSKRMYEALRGLGKPARLVLFPKEGHSYRAEESILHQLWEIDNWLERHLKANAPIPKA